MKILDRVPEFAPLITNPYETVLGVARVCLIASQATIVTLAPASPEDVRAVNYITIVQPCKVKSDVMRSVFFEKAWKRMRMVRAWSKLG